MFGILSVQSGYKEELRMGSRVPEFPSEQVSRELGSAREAEKMAEQVSRELGSARGAGKMAEQVSRELGSAREAEKMALSVHLVVQLKQFAGGVQLRVQVWSVKYRATS
jgi:hypothetical protein